LEIQLLIKDDWVPIIPFDGYVRVVQLYIENNANKTNISWFFSICGGNVSIQKKLAIVTLD
jgi:hypothetical protein